MTTVPDQETTTAEHLYNEAYQCLVEGDYSRFAALCAPKFVLNLSDASNVSLAELEDEAKAWRIAFTGYDHDPTEEVRFPFRGGHEIAVFTKHLLIHTGPFRLPGGTTIDATSRKIEVRVATFIHVDGVRIDRLNILLNTAGFLKQMRSII